MRELRKYFKTSSTEEIDDVALNSTAEPLEANFSGDRCINENKENGNSKTDMVNNSDGTETVKNLVSDSDTVEGKICEEISEKASINDSVRNSIVANNDTENSLVNETNLVDNLANQESETDSKVGNGENSENFAGKPDSVENKNCDRTSDNIFMNPSVESEMSRIPVSEISTGELVKRELGLTIAPEACCVLGEDLLRKLANGVACDCVVSVGDWEFPAHR